MLVLFKDCYEYLKSIFATVPDIPIMLKYAPP